MILFVSLLVMVKVWFKVFYNILLSILRGNLFILSVLLYFISNFGKDEIKMLSAYYLID